MADIKIKLTQAEALVLFEWLAKLDTTEPPPFADLSEQAVVWRIQGQLESTLKEPFASNYGELLKQAKQEVEKTKRP
jgi:hypothetical protein